MLNFVLMRSAFCRGVCGSKVTKGCNRTQADQRILPLTQSPRLNLMR